ncbi:MAG: LacI family DNA-binding transcriptional regulator [Lentisphaerae bacterium]|nr:LacI family DNA-binding transcriptional regulator [Lentisphaerota bacterium]
MSTATISRVLNDSPLVTEPTRRRVLKAVEALAYRPSHAARTLARRCTDTLGVVFPRIGSGFYTEILQGIDEIAAAHGFHLVTAFAHGLRDEKELMTQFMRGDRVDAAILLNLDFRDPSLFQLGTQHVPVVLIDEPIPGADLSVVEIDNRGGAEAAMMHLLGHGYRDIAVIAGPPGNYDSDARLESCLTVANRIGVTIPEERLFFGNFTSESGETIAQQWFDEGRPIPRAILALNDVMALGVMETLRAHGLRVPEDVALAGMDDCEAASYVGLTTVHVPIRDMGREACRIAVAHIKGALTVEKRVMPTQLITRRTCGCSEG